MLKKITTVFMLMASAWLCACTDPTEATSEAATFTVSPDPAVAAPSTDGRTYTITGDDTHPDQIIAYPWKATFTVTMEETAGVGRDITAMSLRVQQASGGIVITPATGVEHYDYTSSTGSNRLEGKGRTSVSFEVWYDLPNKGREALATVTFTFYDDNDASFSESYGVKIV